MLSYIRANKVYLPPLNSALLGGILYRLREFVCEFGGPLEVPLN